MNSEEDVLYPVILPVPEAGMRLERREKVLFLSEYARKALALSAEKSGLLLMPDQLQKDERGAPIPLAGIHWSISHKPEYVAGLAGKMAVGIDIEAIRSVHPGVIEKVVSSEEAAILEDAPLARFFRYWTAKEAVLKAAGRGIGDLERCRVVSADAADRLSLSYGDRIWKVAHHLFNGHIAAVVETTPRIEWQIGINAAESPEKG